MKRQPVQGQRRDTSAPSPINDQIDWTDADERAADAAMARLNAHWEAQAAQPGIDIDAQMAQEVDALDDDDEG